VTARDTGNHGSIAGGRTVYDGSGVNVADPGEYVTPGLSRASSLGRAIIGCVRLSTNTGTLNIGWANSVAVGASMQSALRIGNGVIQIIAGGSTLTASLSDDIIGHYDAHLEFAVVLRAAGAYCFVRGGAATAWKLVWVDSTDVVATVYPHWTSHSSPGHIWNKRVTDNLPAPYTTTYGLAYYRAATTADGDTASGLTDALTEHTITAATGVTQEFSVRRADDNNRLIVRMDQAAGTIKLFEKVGGVETQVGTTGATQTWANGTQYRIVVIHDGLLVLVHVNKTLKITYDASSLLYGNTGAKVSHAGADLIVSPRDVSLPFPVTQFMVGAIFPVGDSKTNGQGDTGSIGLNGYPPLLTASLPGDWYEEPGRVGLSGYTVADILPVIDAALALRTAITPSHVLINLGTNDYPLGTAQADFEDDLGFIIDRLHSKWPAARVGIAIPYRLGGLSAGQITYMDTVRASWFDNLINARSSYCFRGPDEYTALGFDLDGGATYTDDGIHPNHAGYVRMAAAWKTAMGY